MILGFDSIGRLTLGQLPGSFTNTVLTAGAGVFALAGQPATFKTAMATSVGAYVETGFPVSFATGLVMPAGQGVFAVAGQPATFGITFATAAGSYRVTGSAATLKRDFVNWFPQPALAGSWTAAGAPGSAWTPVGAPTEIWTADTAMSIPPPGSA